MLVPNQEIKTTCMPANREYYKNKGYKCDKIKQPLIVKVEDLCKSSHEKIEVICDYCGKQYQIKYHYYYKVHQSTNPKDCCKKCRQKKFEENFKNEYGVVNPFQLDKCKEKSIQTSIEKYGVPNPAQSKEVKDKIKNTFIERYGVSSIFHSAEVRKKIEQTNIERYGVKNVFNSEEIQEKIKNTNEYKYGKGNIAHTPLISQKIKDTNMRKYGVPYTTQSEEVIAKMRKSLYKNGNVASSKPEKQMCELLHSIFGEQNCVDNFPLDRLNLDCLVKVKDNLIDFEYDGMYWHKGKETSDKKRNYYLLRRNYKIVRIKANKKDTMPTKEQIINAVDYVVKSNHSLTYIDMNI